MRFVKTIVSFLFFVGFVLLCLPVQAQNLAQGNSPRSMQGVRPLGMGGAFTAVDGSDENVLFYNPAGIPDYEKKLHMQFALPTVEFSLKAISFFASDLPDLGDDIDNAATNSDKINVFDTFANGNMGRFEEVGVHGNIATAMHKYFAASIFYENRSIMGMTNPASNTIDIEALSQAGVQIGSGLALFDGLLNVGGAVKFVERHLISETITQRDIIANPNFSDIFDTDNFGFGVGVDLGIKAKLPVSDNVGWYHKLDPRFAVTVQDIADTRFTNGTGRQKQSTTFGMALQPQFGAIKTIFALDLRDLERDTDFLLKTHIGAEVMWDANKKVLKSLSARLGASEGYLTGGVGVDLRYFKFNFATWGREIGQNTYQKQSRMFGFQFAAGF